MSESSREKSSNEKSPEHEALYRRFENLLLGTTLSDEEKQALSKEILKVIYGDRQEAV